MNHALINAPAARSWREIPQPVKARAMSNGGRWRLVMAGVRTVALTLLLGSFLWGAWLVLSALREDAKHVPASAKAVPMKAPELQTMRDGVLDGTWLARTLELAPGVTLLELDLQKLRERVLSDRQVMTATLTRRFPDRLIVQVTERMPIARVRVVVGVVQQDLLVARDGVLFPGYGYDVAMLRTLPWLDGVVVARDGAAFQSIPNMEVVARLLADAQFSAPHLYHQWQSVSLARLEADREIEITTKDGTKGLFTAKGSFFMQLARFDNIVDRLARQPDIRASIDLTLGREVPVTIERPDPLDPRAPAAAGLKPLFPSSQSKNKREL